ncbi:rod shape-determining protein MreC [Chitinispirillales bacterium ANBcel5]|uniref:rod shape-determining protein MreC n=1 Tax=Cellulosispirillum alkaliphilum TaxID=3039283 RepID=UPI002A547A08|nr:rod shape-determining protein MreC [Chitinispirillales bacterium ANBcel5]
MHWIIQFIVVHRNFCSLLLTSLLSLWMISLSPDMHERTVYTLKMSVFYPFQATVSYVDQVKDVFKENERRRDTVATLRTQLSLIKEKGAENTRLRKLLGFSEQFDYELNPVRVIARDPSPLYRSIVVNAGKRDGVQLYMPLISEQGVVGKVVQLTQNMSLVQLLKDPSNRTSVMDRRSRYVGILETENGKDFFVRYRTHEDIEPGDKIITSGLGGIYPKGLLVGEVKKITENYNPLFKTVYVDPAVDFDRLEELFIMMLPPQWSAFRSELDSIKIEND